MRQTRKHLIAWSVLILAACTGEPAEPDPLTRQLDSLRDVTRAYQSFDAGQAAGYDIKITDCMADAQGAMGFHYGKGSLIDGSVSALQPEVLMYEPASNGQPKLVGVEYVVPFTAWSSSTPPTLYGESFQRNEMFQVWALHAWIWKDNPRGVFSSWNPTVSCAQASS